MWLTGSLSCRSIQAYWEAEQEAELKARTKREERVIKRWMRLVHGLRLRQRLQEQYANKPQTEERRWLDTQAHTTEAVEADNVSQFELISQRQCAEGFAGRP